MGKLRQRHFLDGASTQAPRQAAILHHPALADIDSVMRIAATGSDHVRAQRWFTPGLERTVAGSQAAGRCMLFTGLAAFAQHMVWLFEFHRSLPSLMCS